MCDIISQNINEVFSMHSTSKKETNHDSDYINILYDEWKFRLSQYWSLTSKTVLLSFILFFIPYMKDAWGANTLDLPNQIFPIVGIIFSIITCLLSTVEMKKINTIKASIKKYIITYSSNIDKPYAYDNIFNHNLPITICLGQIIIGIFVIISIS